MSDFSHYSDFGSNIQALVQIIFKTMTEDFL